MVAICQNVSVRDPNVSVLWASERKKGSKEVVVEAVVAAAAVEVGPWSSEHDGEMVVVAGQE
jgi:hypothetical protein